MSLVRFRPEAPKNADVAQAVARILGKDEVMGSTPIISSIYGPVVQLVRTLACHARGRGFESHPDRHHADLAHLVERDLAKVEVAGSSPVIRSSTL